MPDQNKLGPLRALLLAGVPIMLQLVLYRPALDYDFVWMDETEIPGGTLIVPPGSMGSVFFRPLHVTKGYKLKSGQNAYYRPLQLLLVSYIYHNSGPNPRVYHLSSLAIGAVYASLFAFLAWLLFRQFAPALLTAVLVVAHPYGIEAFVWISGVSEGLAALWIFGSLITAILCMSEPDRRRAVFYAIASWTLLIAALLSKEKSVVLPALLLAMLFSVRVAKQPAWLVREQGDSSSRLVDLLLLVQIGSVLGYILVLRPMVLGNIGVSAGLTGGSWVTQWLTALATWPATIGGMFLPAFSTTSDAVRIIQSANPMVWLGLAMGAGSFLLWILLLRTGRGIAAFGLAWLWIAWLPTSGLVPMIHAHADRYLFLSLGGAALFVVALLMELLQKFTPAVRQVALAILGIAATAGLAQLSWARLPNWSSTMTLFAHDVAYAPEFREGRFHMALRYHKEGHYREAGANIDILLEQMEDTDKVRSYINEVGLYQLACYNKSALKQHREIVSLALDIATEKPDVGNNPGIRDCLGRAYEELKEYQRALDVYLAIIPDMTGDPPPGLSLAIARTYIKLNQPDKARNWLERAGNQSLNTVLLRKEAARIRSLLQP